MESISIAVVSGDGSGPEMMAPALAIAIAAARKDGIRVIPEETPMGWKAYRNLGDTLPEASLKRAVEVGTVFFGGVGNPTLDKTIGVEFPEMKPEKKCLLALRKAMGLLLNFRPMIYFKELDYLANVRPETIPDEGIQQVWIRFLLQDSYFGNEDYANHPAVSTLIKPNDKITGNEDAVVDIAYYTREAIETYARAAFAYGRSVGLPVISVDKANVISRYVFWRKIVTRIGEEEFPDVPLCHQYVDAGAGLLLTPAKLHGVIICGNEHGDILSDGAAVAVGGMGLMQSSAINPKTGAAMFESGAGTAPTLAGTNTANPIGRILAGAMMLRHLGATKGAASIENAVKQAMKNGYRTADMLANNKGANAQESAGQLLSTSQMGKKIFELL